MAFEISFTADPNEFLDDDQTLPSALGLIRLGTFEEKFASSLCEWKKETTRLIGRALSGPWWRELIARFS
jgi:hypothetical protein